ncbi:MAG TPA: hypothetical protein VM791_06660 [Vicinamibacterales bacterium]|nr:hypothetical protein [Vicinamibacterales bacterium]
MVNGVNRNLATYEQLREMNIPLDTEPAVTFRPYLPGKKPKPGATPGAKLKVTAQAAARRGSLEELAFLPRLKVLTDALDVYRKAGATLTPIELPPNQLTSMLSFVLSTEGAAAFDDLTRTADIKDPSLNTWPNTFRTHRFVPAVEYIRAQRARTLLMRQMDDVMSKFDVFLSSTSRGSLSLTNLTGHPAVALKAGFVNNLPVEIMVTGRLYDEATMLRVALAYERATNWHTMNPKI